MLYLWCKVARDSTTTTTNEHRQRQQQQQQQRRQLGSNCFYTMPGLCSTDAVEFFRIVRIVYVKPSTSPVTDNNIESPSVIYPINYETFIPDLVQRQQNASPSISSSSSSSTGLHVDKMKDTFAKVIAFLHQSGMNATSQFISSFSITIFFIHQSFSFSTAGSELYLFHKSFHPDICCAFPVWFYMRFTGFITFSTTIYFLFCSTVFFLFYLYCFSLLCHVTALFVCVCHTKLKITYLLTYVLTYSIVLLSFHPLPNCLINFMGILPHA